MKFTLSQFREKYGTNDKCLRSLLDMRVSDFCPDCGVETNWSRVQSKGQKRPCYQCQWCRHQVYPMQGTIFASSHMPLADWFYILYLMTVTRHGVSAKEVQRQLGCAYNTAHRNCHLIRVLLGMNEGQGKMSGHVEADEHYSGGKHPGVRGRGAKGKTKIFGMVQRGGQTRTFVVDDVKKKTIMPIIEQNVEVGTPMTTDEFLSYNAVAQSHPHTVVKHGKKEFVNKQGQHTNSVEGYWSIFKKSVKSTHIHISRRHTQKYLGEFDFRYSHRATPWAMFEIALAKLARPA